MDQQKTAGLEQQSPGLFLPDNGISHVALTYPMVWCVLHPFL